MNIQDIDEKIKELEKEIEELKEQKRWFNGLPQAQKIAELLHEKQCHWNHTDGCGWYYENWHNPGYARKEYLKKAEAMLKEMPYNEVLRVIKFM